MSAERTTGLILLIVAFFLGLALLFLPLGEAWVESGGTRTTQEFGLLTKDVETAPAGDPGNPTSTTTWYYVDDGLAGTAGITYLQAMGPLAAVGVLFVLLAVIMTAVPRTRPTRAGGWLALPGAIFLFAAGVLAVLGMPLHAEYEVGNEAIFTWDMTGGTVAAVTIFMATLGAGLGLTRPQTVAAPAQPPADDWSDLGDEGSWNEDDSWDQEEQPAQAGATRYLRCPDCTTVVEAEYNVIPICPECGFGQEEEPAYAESGGGTGTTA